MEWKLRRDGEELSYGALDVNVKIERRKCSAGCAPHFPESD
jgi:hypothetical protein